MVTRIVHATTLAIAAVGVSDPLLAQDATNITLEEVIVTAQKRAQNLQEVPIAVSAITASQLENSGVTSSIDLTNAIAGLDIARHSGNLLARLRGIGTRNPTVGNENSVAIYVDGVVITSLTGSVFELNNLQQIEVLKGPQGTLFGRNATGGVINITTKEPTQEFQGKTSISYGNYDTVTGSAYLTGGITPTVAADFSLYVSHQADGYAVNRATGTPVGDVPLDLLARSKWLFTPSDTDRITLAVDYARNHDHRVSAQRVAEGTTAVPAPGVIQVPEADPWDVSTYYDPERRVEHYGGSLKYAHDFDFGEFQVIGAYREADSYYVVGLPVTPWLQRSKFRPYSRQWTGEVQLTSAAQSSVQWTVGGFYIDQLAGDHDLNLTGSLLAPVTQVDIIGTQTDLSYAGYGQATVPIPGLANTNFTGGVRYTWERRGLDNRQILTFAQPGPIVTLTGVAEETFEKVTFRAALDHHFTQDVMGYISFNRGFRSGLYSFPDVTSVVLGGPQPTEPEVLDAYEIGLKTELFDGRVRLNSALFYYDYTNVIVTTVTGSANIQSNGAKAELYGADFDVEAAITDRFSLRAGLELLHSEYLEYPSAVGYTLVPAENGGGVVAGTIDAAGNELPHAPKFTGNLGAEYSVPTPSGEWNFNVSYGYNGGTYGQVDNLLKIPSFNNVNAQLGWTSPSGRSRIFVWGKNISNDVRVYDARVVNPNNAAGWGGVALEERAPPRMYGITFEQSF